MRCCLTLLLTAQSLAAPALSGVVRDVVRPGRPRRSRHRPFQLNGGEQQTVTGTRWPLLAGRAAPGRCRPDRAGAVVRRGAADAWRRRGDDRGRHRALQPATVVRNRDRDRSAHGTAAARRAGQRQRADAGRHPPLAGRRRRRRAAADSDVQPVPPHQQPGVASDRAGRVAARHRPERRQPHAGAARRRAVQRSVRRLGVLDARAARRDRSHRGRGQRRARASTATTRWAASSTS